MPRTDHGRSKAARDARAPSRKPVALLPQSYWCRSQRPLQCLLFLLPGLFAYELGVLIFATDAQQGVTHHIVARTKLIEFFQMLGLGIPPLFLPGLLVVAVLLSWHFVRRDPWKIEPRLYGGMLLESLALAMPLFVFAIVLLRKQQSASMVGLAPWLDGLLLAGGAGAGQGWQADLAFSVGAGVYEEMLFRLIGITVLHALFVDALALPRKSGAALAVGLSAVLFALYHFPGFVELSFSQLKATFSFGDFLFFTTAGVYLAVIFVLRGFGIVVAVHALYDVMVVALKYGQG